MQCERARELLSAFVDDELDAEQWRAVAAHVADCRSCADQVDDFRRIGSLLAEAGRERLPGTLAVRVRRNIASVPEAEDEEDRHPRSRVTSRLLPVRRSFLRQAATIVAIGALSAAATWWFASSSNRTAQLEHDVLSAHVRSLLQESPVQVAASDTHTVKPWFAGRTDFAPEVKDLTGEGFPLVGGRLDY